LIYVRDFYYKLRRHGGRNLFLYLRRKMNVAHIRQKPPQGFAHAAGQSQQSKACEAENAP
jgi:hypothetical protein